MALEFKPADVESIAKALFGAPNAALSRGSELRFGSQGSMSVRLDRATWHSHEDQIGGGMIDLVARETGKAGREAVEWMRAHGVDVPEMDRANGQRPSPSPSPKTDVNISHQAPPPRARIVDSFDYVDENGAVIFQVCRFETGERTSEGKLLKTFKQRAPDASERDGWSWKVKDARQVPYRLPELIEAVAQGLVVFVAEGEKAVEALRDLGAPATCNAAGANKFPDSLVPFFAGAQVVILPDNDEPGRKHADLVAAKLRKVARSIRVLDLPGLPPKGDVVDWREAGGTIDGLYALVDAHARDPFAKPFVSKFGALPWEALDTPGPEHDYIIDGFLTAGEKSVIGGPSRSGKSFLSIHAGMAVARGTEFFGRGTQPGLVIYQAGEGARGVKKRLRAYRQHFGVPAHERVPFVLLQSPVDLYRPEGDTSALIAEIKALAASYDVPLRLVVIDTLATAASGADENSGKDMGVVLANIARIGAQTGAHVCLVHHMNADGKKLRGHTSIYANVDQVVLVVREQERKIRTMRLDKQKDDEDGIRFDFELRPIEIGERPDGRPITSCVVIEVGDRSGAVESVARKAFKLRDNEQLIFRALLAALAEHGQQAPSDLRLPLGTRVVAARFWKAEYEKIASFETGGENDPAAQERRASAIRQQMSRAGRSLLQFGVLGRSEPWVWWTGRAVRGFPQTFQQGEAVWRGPPGGDANGLDNFDAPMGDFLSGADL